MKIAIVTPTFPPYAGGIGNVALANATELIKLGYEVTVFTPLYQADLPTINGLHVVRLKPLIKHGNAAFVPGLCRQLLGFDFIHLHYPFFGGAEIIWWRAKKFKRKGAKIILHYHMDVVGTGITKWLFKFHRFFLLPRIIKMADQVLVTSLDYAQNSNLARWLEKNPAKFIEVPNGVDLGIFSPTVKDSNLLNKYQIKESEKIVLFVGGLDQPHYFKGVDHLLIAMSRLRTMPYDWRLIIVGSGELMSLYSDLAHQLKINLRTIFTGYVSTEDLPKYYNLADLVVLPSIDKSEAFGLALVEGMACQKPVVATNLAGVRSVVSEKMTGLLAEPKNDDDLAAKINHLLSQPNLAAEMGQAGLRQVKLKYDWRIIGQQLDELYKKLKNQT